MSAASEASQVHYSNLCALVSFVILYYDYALVFSNEVKYFWPPKNRITRPSALYLITRFLSIFGHIPSFIASFATGSIKSKCAIIQLFHILDIIIVQLLTGILCLLRVSALYSHNYIVVSLLVILKAILFALACWTIIAGIEPTIFLDLDVPGCAPHYTSSTGVRLSILWAGVFVYDLSIFLLTLNKALKMGLRHRYTLWRVLLRDGTIYFCILTLANLFNILTFALAPPLLRGIGATPTNVLSATLVGRLMISLRRENERLSVVRARAAAEGQPGMTAFADEYDLDETETTDGPIRFRRNPGDDEGEVELGNIGFDNSAVLGAGTSASDSATGDEGISVDSDVCGVAGSSRRGVHVRSQGSSSETSSRPLLRNKNSELSTTTGTGTEENGARLISDPGHYEGEGQDESRVLEVRRSRDALDQV